jgi:hypothetical protein
LTAAGERISAGETNVAGKIHIPDIFRRIERLDIEIGNSGEMFL